MEGKLDADAEIRSRGSLWKEEVERTRMFVTQYPEQAMVASGNAMRVNIHCNAGSELTFLVIPKARNRGRLTVDCLGRVEYTTKDSRRFWAFIEEGVVLGSHVFVPCLSLPSNSKM